MKINIYYGGRGVVGDPSGYVIKRMMHVFEELNVKCERFDLFDQKTNITTLPQTLKDADGIILATTVEWHGVGGFITSFLDACWLYGDKERIADIYMAPVVMATTYGEKEAELDLKNAWESLGGQTCNGICGYIADAEELVNNENYVSLIEKCAENIYRNINQKTTSLPVSSRVVNAKVYKTRGTFLTQQEAEQLSEYVSDDTYVNKQKNDIKELAELFKGKMDLAGRSGIEKYVAAFKEAFVPQPEAHVRFRIKLDKENAIIAVVLDNKNLEVKAEDIDNVDVELTVLDGGIEELIHGRKTFQGGFMEGSIRLKGDFTSLRLLDNAFPF